MEINNDILALEMIALTLSDYPVKQCILSFLIVSGPNTRLCQWDHLLQVVNREPCYSFLPPHAVTGWMTEQYWSAVKEKEITSIFGYLYLDQRV